MDNRQEIWNELMEISPLVAGIPLKDDLYGLPEGYFDNLSENILNGIRASQTESLPAFLDQLDKKANLPIPGNYFESFPDKLMNLIKANQAVSAREEMEGLSPLLQQIGRITPYLVPAGYFQELGDRLMAGIQASKPSEETEIETDLINSLKVNNVYQVPVGYFEGFPEKMLAFVKRQSRQAKVLQLGRSRTFLKYAAAAVVAGALLVGGSLFFNRHAPNSVETTNPALAAVSDQEILNYLELQNVPVSDMNNIATVDINENDSKDLLGDVSDEELQNYLNEHVSQKDLKDN